MQCTGTNGRIDIIGQPTTAVFTHADQIPTKEYTSYRDAMIGNWYNTELSNAFFSKENIQILQNGIRAGVYRLSNGQYLIGPQDSNELKIIMRAMFLQYSKNVSNNITEQISNLNEQVLQYSTKQVYGEIVAYMKYRQDVSTISCPLALPEMPKKNDKQLIFNRWF
jgi:hypothetical protein